MLIADVLKVLIVLVMILCESAALQIESCFKCKGRGHRKSAAYKDCYRVNEGTETVPCVGGCVAAYGLFANGENSIERWCVDSENDMKLFFARAATKISKETVDGMSFACDSIAFDSDGDQYKRGPLIYEYCWCQGEKCNGNVANRMIGSGGGSGLRRNIKWPWVCVAVVLTLACNGI